ncbi:MAG: hypothetical protein ACXWNQ_06760, partial [Anaerolineales bacterium]
RAIARLRDALRYYWSAIAVVGLVILVYVWFASSGTLTTWNSQTRYYADLARGFQKGHLYLAIKVAPSIIKSPDPYEPVAPWVPQGPVDYAYYQGRYYLAWEPVPALIVLFVQESLHRWLGDLQLSFGFLCGVFALQCLLLTWIWEHYFRALPRWLLFMSILLAGLAGPTTYMLNNYNAGRIYDAAVFAGQFFLLSGFFTAVIALHKPPLRWTLLWAGVLWALALGTRPDLVVSIGVMVLAISFWALRMDGWSRNTIQRLLLLIAPLMLGCMALAWYNWARFGSVLETGYYYQMAGVNVHKHWNESYALSYVLPSLYNYLLNPVLITSSFPFFNIQIGTGSLFFAAGTIPDFYHAQFVTGILWSAPFAIFALVPLKPALTGRRVGGLAAPTLRDGKQRFLTWIELTLALCCLVAFALVVGYFWVAMRFLENFTPSLIVLSAVGFWHGYEYLSGKRLWKAIYSGLGIVLASASIAISTLGTISVLTLGFRLVDLFPFLTH